MSAGTVAPYRSEQQTGQDGFAQLLHAEWTKFRSVRGWVIGMVIAALLMVLVGLFAAGQSNIQCSIGPNGPVRTGRVCIQPSPTGPGGEPVTDSFYFVHEPLPGNGSITAELTSLTGRYVSGAAAGPALSPGLEPWSKAGIIIKQSTRPGSAYAAMMVTGSRGVRMQYDYTQDIAGQPGLVSGESPRWLRLTRSGSTVTGYESADGRAWTRVGTATLPGLSGTVQAGLFATSPIHAQLTSSFGGFSGDAGPSLATGVFGHVSLLGPAGGTAPGAWAGQLIGANGPVLGQDTGFREAGSQFTVTGSGDIAPVAAGPGSPGPPTATIEQHLVGAFAGLVAVSVIAVMFITAEYRRGLIRTTLAASPRRGRILAAKAVVIASVTFVAGLAASLVAVIVGNRLSADQGTLVFPAAWPTELRVIAGTAALLAVAAVLALGIGTILRRSAIAVTMAIVAIVLPYILSVAPVLPLGAADWLLRLTPAAAFAIQQSIPAYPQVTAIYTPIGGYFPLAPWACFAVLCGYAALTLAAAAWLLRRRDA